MGWSEIKDAAGNVIGQVHICTRGQRRRPCATPGCGNPASVLCDFPVKATGRMTCSAAACSSCATKISPGVDYCRPHGRAYRDQAHARESAEGVPAQTPRQTNAPHASGAFAPAVGPPSPEDQARLKSLLANGVPRDVALEMLGVR